MRNQSVLWAACGAVVGGLGLLGGLGFVGGLGRADHGGYYSSAMLWAAEVDQEELDRGVREVVKGLNQLLAQQAPQAAQSTGQTPNPEAKTASPAPAETKKLLPPPAPEEIKKAEKAVDEVFGRDMAKAKTAADKAKLAGEILKTAREEKDQAVRFVLAQRAKQLAVQAQDAKLAVQAAEVLAQFEPAEGPISAKAAADKAHGLWAKGEFAKGAPRLSYWTDAAELYLRALDNLEGFEKTIAERRLKELGWLGHFLPPEKVVEMFKIPNATINGEEITWDSKRREWLLAEIGECRFIDFGFDIRASQKHLIHFNIGPFYYAFGRGMLSANGEKKGSFRYTNFRGLGTFGGGEFIDDKWPDTQWHSLRLTFNRQKLCVYYDHQLVDELSVPQGSIDMPIKIGFGDHETQVSIRRVFLKYH